MQFRISWMESNRPESLLFSDEAASQASPSVNIYGRRFFLNAADCQNAEIIHKVNTLQNTIFSNIEQFAKSLQTEAVSKFVLHKETGERKFLEETVPKIEMARIENANARSQSPYFRSNSVYPSQLHPLYAALGSKNHEWLKQLAMDPYLLLINEKFTLNLPDGTQQSVSPLEYAVLANDLEAYNLILSAAAFNKETPLPLMALRRLGVDKATPYILAYVDRKPNLIDPSFYRGGFEEMEREGFSTEAITALRKYYEANVLPYDQGTLSTIGALIGGMLTKELNSAEFLQFKHMAKAQFQSSLTNLDAIESNDTILYRICAFVAGLDLIQQEQFPNWEEKKPIVYSILKKILQQGEYTMNEKLYATLKEDLHDISPKERLEEYRNSQLKLYPLSDQPIESYTSRATKSSKNLVTLLGKPQHITQQLQSGQQERAWNEKIELSGGNKLEYFESFVGQLLLGEGKLSFATEYILFQYLNQAKLHRGVQDAHHIRELTEKINDGSNIVYLKFKTPGHTQALIFYKNYYILCDRRVLTRHGEKVDGANIKIYSFKMKLIESDLKKILNCSQESYELLDRLNTEIGASLQHELPLKPQKHSNCSWASDIAPALLVANQLEKNPKALLQEGRFDKEIEDEMHSLTHYAKYVAIRDYVLKHRLALSESVGDPDTALTGKALLYTLFKCSVKSEASDPHYLQALDELIYSGLAISHETVMMTEYSPAEKEKMLSFLSERYSLKGISTYLKELGYPLNEKYNDAEAFLFYLCNPRPSNGVWPNSLLF